MDFKTSTFALDNGLDLRQVITTGSVLHINEDYDDGDCYSEVKKPDSKHVDLIGQPVKCFKNLENTLKGVDENGYVKKKIIEEGGGLPLNNDCTISIAFSGYWEGDTEPFDVRKIRKPLVVDLKDSGLLPGMEMAIRSMLVGEMSVFLFTHQVMYGEMGIPPRIKPKASCVFFIKLLKNTITPMIGKIDFSEPNMFHRVHHEVKLLYSSGATLHKSNNYPVAIQLFRKAIFMLHKCRLADESEEKTQEKLLIKLYTNLAVCYNKSKQPLKACTACNEIRRLGNLWNNGKVLFQNAKALRMIGQFDCAEKRLKKALKLCPENDDIKEELELLYRAQDSCNQTKLLVNKVAGARMDLVTDDFKKEVASLIKNFKENADLYKLVMPSGLNSSEVGYIKEICIKENLFFNKIKKELALDKEEDHITSSPKEETGSEDDHYALDKFKETSWDADIETLNDID